MLRNLKSFFDQYLGTPMTDGSTHEHALQLVTAALLIEVMRADRDIKYVERQAVVAAIENIA